MIKKLTELLYQASEVAGKKVREEIRNALKKKKCYNSRYDRNESIYGIEAQHLIKNNVVVLPCVVGEAVWFNHAELEETCIAKVVEISINYYTPSMPIWVSIEFESKMIGKHTVKITSDVFEIVCHKSKDDADKKLQEMIQLNRKRVNTGECFDAVEVCPHCEQENVYPYWDVKASGYVAVCNHCGKEIMLCDECFHADDNTAQNCDWCATVNGGKCFRGVTHNSN